jgi:hypothetical protein
MAEMVVLVLHLLKLVCEVMELNFTVLYQVNFGRYLRTLRVNGVSLLELLRLQVFVNIVDQLDAEETEELEFYVESFSFEEL